MMYEIVELEAKTVAGLTARTCNNAPDMGAVIGGLWQRFYQDGVCASISHRKNEKALGIYTDYSDGDTGEYSVLVACEVEDTENIPKNVTVRLLPKGKYAKFIVKGHMQKAVADFWEKLWKMNLPRSFICDFEEYQNSDFENAEIHIYIGLKEV